MLKNILGFGVLLVISIIVALTIYLLTRKSLRRLLDEVIKLPSGTTFYLRLFSIGLLFITLSVSLESDFNLKADAAFMEYIWEIADGLSSLFGNICFFILGYLTLVTIILAVLRYKND
jgi:hypothetical protein